MSSRSWVIVSFAISMERKLYGDTNEMCQGWKTWHLHVFFLIIRMWHYCSWISFQMYFFCLLNAPVVGNKAKTKRHKNTTHHPRLESLCSSHPISIFTNERWVFKETDPQKAPQSHDSVSLCCKKYLLWIYEEILKFEQTSQKVNMISMTILQLLKRRRFSLLFFPYIYLYLYKL